MIIPPGEAGAKATLSEMRRLARDGAEDPVIRTLALQLTRGVLQKDYEREACEVLTFCRDRIRYVRDTRFAEILQIPRRTLQLSAGDCDDKSILLAALLSAIGHRVRFIAISIMPGQYSHVWVQDEVRGRWLDLEPTEPVKCGERVPEAGVIGNLTLEL